MSNRYELPAELLDIARLIEQLAQVRGMSHETAAVAVLVHQLQDSAAAAWKISDALEGLERIADEATRSGPVGTD